MTIAQLCWYAFLVVMFISVPYTYWRIICFNENVPTIIRWLSHFAVIAFTSAIALALSVTGYIGQSWIVFIIIMAWLAHHNLLKHFSRKFNLDVVDKNDKENGGF